VPVLYINNFFKSPLYRAFPTTADPADRAVDPPSPLSCQALHGYGVSSAHHGEVRGCRRACERTPLGAAAAAPPAGACSFDILRRERHVTWVAVSIYFQEYRSCLSEPPIFAKRLQTVSTTVDFEQHSCYAII
jgi:hypothetical protein